MSCRSESFLKLFIELSYSSRIEIALSMKGDFSSIGLYYYGADEFKSDCKYFSATEWDLYYF